MGVLLSPQACCNQKMMKSVAVVALCMFAAAVAEPEASADAGYHYGYAGYPHHYGYAHHGYYGYGPYAYGHHYGKRSADAEPTAVADADAGYHYGYAYGHHYGKRSADAEPTADADAGYFYGRYGYGYPRAYGYGYAHHGYHGYPYAYAGYHH